MFEISEKYRKYVIRIQLKNKIIYTVWGSDLSDPSEIDRFILVDNKILVFLTIETLYNKLFLYEDAFYDNENLISWLKSDKELKEYADYNFDILLNVSSSEFMNEKSGLGLLNCINLIKDYSSQTNNLYLLDILKHTTMSQIIDYLYDAYIWKDKDIHIKISDLIAECFKSHDNILDKLHEEISNNLMLVS